MNTTDTTVHRESTTNDWWLDFSYLKRIEMRFPLQTRTQNRLSGPGQLPVMREPSTALPR